MDKIWDYYEYLENAIMDAKLHPDYDVEKVIESIKIIRKELMKIKKLEEVEIEIKNRIIVKHLEGFFEITKEELDSVLKNNGNIDLDKINALYDYKYHPRWYAG